MIIAGGLSIWPNWWGWQGVTYFTSEVCTLVFEVNQKWIRYSYSSWPWKPWRFVRKDWHSKINAWHSPGHQGECMTKGLQRLTDLYAHNVYLRLIWTVYSHQLLKLQCVLLRVITHASVGSLINGATPFQFEKYWNFG